MDLPHQQNQPQNAYRPEGMPPFQPASEPVQPPSTPQDPGGVDTAAFQQQQPVQPPPQQPPQAAPNATAQTNQAPQDQTQQQPADQAYDPYQNDSALVPGMAKPQPEETLLEWQAPSRPFKQRNRQYFTTIGLISALIALILVFAGQMLPVAVIVAVFFVYYVLNSTPPGMVTHKLTTYGIRIEDTLYYWEEMGRFWYTNKFGSTLLHIEVARFPNRLTILLGDISKEDMTLVLSEVLLNQQPPPTAYEKAAKWLEEKLPIDIES